MSNPKVSVVMPVYNGELYLQQAVDSILNQTFTDFEFIIVNDGSIDNSFEILQSYHDTRIKLINNQKNVGIIESLNKGLEIAKGRYIARMDADDVSLPERLQFQVSYLKTNREIALLGTWAQLIDKNGKVLGSICPPTDPLMLKWRMLFGNNIIHSSVMFVADKIREIGGYNKLLHAEDYDLWSRIMIRYNISQLPQTLIQLRNHSEQISAKYPYIQQHAADLVVCRNLRYLLKREIPFTEVQDLCTVLRNGSIGSYNRLNKVLDIWQDAYETVMNKWNPVPEKAKVIKEDYKKRIITFASIHGNIQRRGTFRILQNAFDVSKCSLLEISTFKCIIKIILGPNLVAKIYRLLRRPDPLQ